MNISNNTICCGCGACEQICSKHAISMRPNKEGFLYPKLEESLCVDCGLCSKICPELHAADSLNPTGYPLAAQAKANKVLDKSSSGGIFSVVAEYVLNNGGVVVGAELTENMKVRHVIVDNVRELNKLCGSKYAQSNTSNIYKSVKELLQQGRFVFFTGTPCQVSALKLFLRRPFENLLTADLICHGVPSLLMFNMIVEYLEKKYKGKVMDYQFRSKKLTGWSRVSACTMLINGKIKHIYYNEMMRAFFQAFLDGHVLRMDCYQCPFTRTERAGDFTMADFWSLMSTNPKFPRQHRGVSMILVNTEKGQSILDACLDKIYMEPSDLDVILAGYNYQLKHPTELTSERGTIFDFLQKYPEDFINKYLRGDISSDKRNFYFTAFKEQIKKILRYGGQY